MGKMPTSARNSAAASRGFTLAEMLVALAVASLGALLVAASINARSPRLLVNRAADELLVDLKRARLLSETSGDRVRLTATPDGYEATAAGIDRSLPRAITIEWNGARTAEIDFASGFDQSGMEIRISARKTEALISIAPVTGKITRVR